MKKTKNKKQKQNQKQNRTKQKQKQKQKTKLTNFKTRIVHRLSSNIPLFLIYFVGFITERSPKV